MPSITVPAGQRCDPVCIPAGALLTVTPASGATATVEYTNGGITDVANGVATWVNWPKGASLTAAASDIANDAVCVRVTATTGAVTVAYDATPTPTALAAFQTDWKSQSGGMQLLARSAVAASKTGDTNETALATITIPAGVVGPNGGLEIRTSWTVTNSANSKTLRVRLGGISGSQFQTLALTTSASASDTRRIRNRNSLSSQVGSAPANAAGVNNGSGSPLPTASVDMSASVDLVISGQLALGSETITLENYEVWLLS